MILLDFFDTSIIKNLVPVRSLKPEYIVFFIDEKYYDSRIAKNTQYAIEQMIKGIHFEYVKVNENDVRDIYRNIVNIMTRFDSEQHIFADLTGGNSLMALTCQRVRFEYGKMSLLHANLKTGEIFDINSGRTVQPIENITLQDYLNARGARNIRDSHHNPDPSEYENILKMAEYLFKNLESWKYLQQQFQKKHMYQLLLVNEHQINNEEGHDVLAIMNKFVEYGFLIDRGNGYYAYPSPKYKEYVITYGIWLELYIYIKSLDYFDEDKVGFRIDWDSSDEILETTNEIDVVVMKNSIPHFISCKMKKPSIYDAYEVGYLSKNFAGEEASGIIATTYCADEEDRNYSFENRCREMGIGMIKTCQFDEESIEEIFSAALME